MQFYGRIGETIVYKGTSYSEIILEKDGKRETIDLGDGFIHDLFPKVNSLVINYGVGEHNEHYGLMDIEDKTVKRFNAYLNYAYDDTVVSYEEDPLIFKFYDLNSGNLKSIVELDPSAFITKIRGCFVHIQGSDEENEEENEESRAWHALLNVKTGELSPRFYSAQEPRMAEQDDEGFIFIQWQQHGGENSLFDIATGEDVSHLLVDRSKSIPYLKSPYGKAAMMANGIEIELDEDKEIVISQKEYAHALKNGFKDLENSLAVHYQGELRRGNRKIKEMVVGNVTLGDGWLSINGEQKEIPFLAKHSFPRVKKSPSGREFLVVELNNGYSFVVDTKNGKAMESFSIEAPLFAKTSDNKDVTIIPRKGNYFNFDNGKKIEGVEIKDGFLVNHNGGIVSSRGIHSPDKHSKGIGR